MSPVNQSIAEKGTKCNAAGKEARQAVYRYTGIALPGVRRGGDSQGKHRWALSACIGILGRRSASLFARVSLSRTFILRFSSRWEMLAGVVRNHWYTEQAFSQLQRLCPALPGVRKRAAPVPLTPPWPHLAKYNAALTRRRPGSSSLPGVFPHAVSTRGTRIVAPSGRSLRFPTLRLPVSATGGGRLRSHRARMGKNLAKYNACTRPQTARKQYSVRFQNKKHPISMGCFLFWNPATSYSPGPSPAKYHRR